MVNLYDPKQVIAEGRDFAYQQAVKLGLRVHHKAGVEKIAQAIAEHLTKPPVQQSKAREAVPVVDPYADPRLATRPVTYHTIEEVEKAIAPIKQRRPDFVAKYADEDGTPVNEDARTVTFSFMGRVETVNMSVPLHWMRKIAETTSKGRIALKTHNKHFEPGNVPEGDPRAYTNVVLG